MNHFFTLHRSGAMHVTLFPSPVSGGALTAGVPASPRRHTEGGAALPRLPRAAAAASYIDDTSNVRRASQALMTRLARAAVWHARMHITFNRLVEQGSVTRAHTKRNIKAGSESTTHPMLKCLAPLTFVMEM